MERDRTRSDEPGRFIVLDGIDGCGKTTQADLLVLALRASTGREVLHLREPGSTGVGEAIRRILLSRELSLGPAVEALLFAAARRQMLDEIVAPALRAGATVVCERFHPSTYAYQAVAGGLDEDSVLALLADWAGAPSPDLVVLFDLDIEAAAGRRGAAGDRIEDKGREFQALVAAGYRRYAERAANVVVVAGGGPRERVAEAVMREVQRVL